MTLKETIKEKLRAVRELFNSEVAAAAAVTAPAAAPPVSATEYTLADGTTKVAIDKLEVGGLITPTPSAAGSVTLQDGTIIAYDAAGIITAITPATVAEEIPVEAAVAPPTQEQMRVQLEKFATGSNADVQTLAVIVKALFENVFGWELRRAKEEADKQAAIAIYNEGFSANKKALDGLFEIVEKMAEMEIVAPTEPEELAFENMSPLEQFRFLKREKEAK